MSTNSVSERSSLITKLTPVQNYQPEIGVNATLGGISSGSLVYHGYCLGTNSQLPNAGWGGAAFSLVMVITSVFNIIRARQHQTAKIISIDEGTLNTEKTEISYDPLLEIANAASKLLKTMNIDVDSSTKNETSHQKILHLLNSFEKSYQASEKTNSQAHQEIDKLKARIFELTQQLEEKSKSQIQDSMIEMKSTSSEQVEELRAELLEAQEALLEYQEAAESAGILNEMYKTQLERLELLLKTSTSSSKDMEEARSIVSNLKKSAENSARSSTTSTPKSSRSTPDSKKSQTKAKREIFKGETGLSPANES